MSLIASSRTRPTTCTNGLPTIVSAMTSRPLMELVSQMSASNLDRRYRSTSNFGLWSITLLHARRHLHDSRCITTNPAKELTPQHLAAGFVTPTGDFGILDVTSKSAVLIHHLTLPTTGLTSKPRTTVTPPCRRGYRIENQATDNNRVHAEDRWFVFTNGSSTSGPR